MKAITAAHQKALDEVDRLADQLRDIGATPIEMLLWCPTCGERHIDVGEFAGLKHHTHACQHCGMVWRPCVSNTVGVRFLPGFKDRTRRDDQR